MVKSKVVKLRCVKSEPSRASHARKGVCEEFLGVPVVLFLLETQEKEFAGGVPVVFFEFQTQEKDCVGGSWEYP